MMFTLFTTTKPFRGQIDVIQRNAIMSWTLLTPRPEIILLGNDEGAADVAQEFGLRHIPDIPRNEFQTPLVNGLFETASLYASHPVICYINADIILMSDFIRAIEQVLQFKKPFLMVGQRWDIDVAERLEFGPSWEERLRSQIKSKGQLHPETGIDYFLFSKGVWGEIPAFAIGRTVWDNWLLYRVRARKGMLIDATPAVMVVHQNHDYAHHPDGERGIWQGEEAKRNQKLAGKASHVFTLYDASFMLTISGLRRTTDISRLRQYLFTLPVIYPRLWLPLRVLLKGLDFLIALSKRLASQSSRKDQSYA